MNYYIMNLPSSILDFVPCDRFQQKGFCEKALLCCSSYFTFDCNFHSVTHCSYRVRCFTFIFSSVFFTGVVSDEVGFIDACLKHFVILFPSNTGRGITLGFTHQIQYVSLEYGDFTFTFVGYCRNYMQFCKDQNKCEEKESSFQPKLFESESSIKRAKSYRNLTM